MQIIDGEKANEVQEAGQEIIDAPKNEKLEEAVAEATKRAEEKEAEEKRVQENKELYSNLESDVKAMSEKYGIVILAGVHHAEKGLTGITFSGSENELMYAGLAKKIENYFKHY